MKINKISEKKVISILNQDDIEIYELEKGFNIQKDYNKQLIMDILEESDSMHLVDNHFLFVELSKSGFGSIKITILFLTPEEYKEKIAENPNCKEFTGGLEECEEIEEEYYEENEEDNDIIDVKEKLPIRVFCFDKLDDVINISQLIKNKGINT